MTDELKPCPFCGGKAFLTPISFPRSIWFQPSCDIEYGCGARMGTFSTEAEAIAAWNTRADDAHIAAQREDAARQALEAAEFAFVAPGVWTAPWKVIRAIDPARFRGEG